MEADRIYAVLSRLAEYVRSPSLSHIRNPDQLQKLAKDIVQAVDRAGSVWTKWEGAREDIIKAASPCWIPEEDLQERLNLLPGPPLTLTDVKQRLRALWEQPWEAYPDDELREGCLAVYRAEKERGTELIAIVGAIREHIEREEERLRRERDEAYRASREQELAKRKQRFLSGADVGWTQVDGSDPALYCRRNGRAFRIAVGKDKRWKLYRVANHQDAGYQLGVYGNRRDANKALDKIAYEPES
ncbi:hypothetical protein [Bradyrhizobium ottawaense]|uniref:AP2/ERF domain-containing protein n=1 Tax=Bradyrhizobium ottawaense TaxID=931866 RepID=A0ABV4FL65_9BRAD